MYKAITAGKARRPLRSITLREEAPEQVHRTLPIVPVDHPDQHEHLLLQPCDELNVNRTVQCLQVFLHPGPEQNVPLHVADRVTCGDGPVRAPVDDGAQGIIHDDGAAMDEQPVGKLIVLAAGLILLPAACSLQRLPLPQVGARGAQLQADPRGPCVVTRRQHLLGTAIGPALAIGTYHHDRSTGANGQRSLSRQLPR